MDYRFLFVSTLFSISIVIPGTNAKEEKHKILVQVPTHIKEHVHTIYKIVKVPVYVKETKGRQTDHTHQGHESEHEHGHKAPHKVEHTGKFEHQHLHKHLHEHHGKVKPLPVYHHHHHSHKGDVGVDHKHLGSIVHIYQGKVSHDHSGKVNHDHFGFVGHHHKGGVGHYHGGLVGHSHGGFVSHGHLGHIGHGHKGLVSHGHAGLVGHYHSGNVAHGHDGPVDHNHSGNPSLIHDDHVEHNHDGRPQYNHFGARQNTLRSVDSQLSSGNNRGPTGQNLVNHSVKPVYYESTIGSFNSISSPITLGIDEVSSSIGSIAEHIETDDDDGAADYSEDNGGSLEYVDLQRKPHRYEVVEETQF